jgi:hypothetical protein
MPCNDVHGQNIPPTIEAAQDHHQEDKDLCGPFCQCNCCQSFIVITYSNHSEHIFSFSKERFSLYAEDFSSIIAIDHWQPPKIA